MKEDRLLHNLLLQRVKRLLSGHCPYEGLPLFGEHVEGQGNPGEPCDEGVIKIAESMKRVNVLNTFQGRPVMDSQYLCWIHPHFFFLQYHSWVVDGWGVEDAL